MIIHLLLVGRVASSVFPRCHRLGDPAGGLTLQGGPPVDTLEAGLSGSWAPTVINKRGGQAVVQIVSNQVVLKRFAREKSFLRELGVLETLRRWDHSHPTEPQLVLYPLCAEPAELLLVLPYAAGGDLSVLPVDSRSSGPDGGLGDAGDEDRLWHQIVWLMTAVRRLHRAGFLHMDIKPENVVRDPAGNLFLIDLGLAAPIEARPRSSAGPQKNLRMIGTRQTMAPEVLLPSLYAAVPVTESSDWWSVGVLVYFLATRGHYPYRVQPPAGPPSEDPPGRADDDECIVWDTRRLGCPLVRDLLFGPQGLLSWEPRDRLRAASRFLAALP